jgi:chromosome segregation ATPase
MFRIFSAIGSMFSAILTKLGLKAQKAADKQWTKDASSIGAAFDVHEEKLSTEYTEFFETVAAAETEYGRQEKELEEINKNRKELEDSLEGALAAIEDANKNGGKTKVNGKVRTLAQVTQDAEDFQAELDKLTEREEKLHKEIDDGENERAELKRELQKMQEELASLPKAKAAAVSKFLSKTKLIERQEKLAGLRKKRSERSPIDAVNEAIDNLESREKVSREMAGVVTSDRRSDYASAGKTSGAKSKIADRLAARAAERGEATGAKAEQKTTEGGSTGPAPEPKF